MRNTSYLQNTKSLKLSEKSKETTNNQGVVDEDDKSALVASNTSELHAELKDLITIQPNQLYLISKDIYPSITNSLHCK